MVRRCGSPYGGPGIRRQLHLSGPDVGVHVSIPARTSSLVRQQTSVLSITAPYVRLFALLKFACFQRVGKSFVSGHLVNGLQGDVSR